MHSRNPKQQQYKALVNLFRKQQFSDNGIHNPFHIEGVAYNYQVLNPWNLWHGNLEADVLLIGQDWGDLKYFKENFTTDWNPEKKSLTNKNLQKLFSIIGYNIGLPDPASSPEFRYLPLFFTNTVLGIKEGNQNKASMALPIKTNWYKEMGVYLISIINIIQPKFIIVMGGQAYDFLRMAYDLPKYKSTAEAISSNGLHPPINGAKLFRVAHCSALGLANRSMEIQCKDWHRINELIKGICYTP